MRLDEHHSDVLLFCMFNQFLQLQRLRFFPFNFNGNLLQAVSPGEISPGWMERHKLEVFPFSDESTSDFGVEIEDFYGQTSVIGLVYGSMSGVFFDKRMKDSAGLEGCSGGESHTCGSVVP